MNLEPTLAPCPSWFLFEDEPADRYRNGAFKRKGSDEYFGGYLTYKA